MKEILNLTALQLGAAIRKGEVSPVEATRAALEQIEARKADNAFTALTAEIALRRAKAVGKKIAAGELTAPLAGVPLGIKENICTKGVSTTCASKILTGFEPPYDATLVEKLDALGAVSLGKLNMDEFAMGSSTENSYFKKTRNPHDLERVPGGSSGGSAAAVAAGEAIAALGSDTGGSIRQPASYCGIVGLKPTYGSVSRYGLVAFASSLDQIGPMGRCVSDVAMLYSAICGRDPHDVTSVRREYPAFDKAVNPNVKGLKIGIPAEYFGEGVSDEVKTAVMNAAKEYEKLGAQLVEISLPSTEYALAAYYIIASAEASSNLARFDGVKYGYRASGYKNLEELYEKTRSEGFGAEVKRRIMLGTYVLSSGYYDAYYKKAKFTQMLIQEHFRKAFESCDVILTPTAPDTAFKIGENINDQIKMYMNDILTVTVNIAGLPAISIPCGTDSKKLPIGCQLIGAKFSEQTLFNTAAAYETHVGGFDLSAALA